VCDMAAFRKGLPHFAVGEVVKGFGRGSKELGIPTANFPENVVDNLPKDLDTGIYFGWANVDNGPRYKMVMSIGWNPYYKNEKKSMEIHLFQETHIMNVFENDFYGSQLRVVLLGYVRPECSFKSLDDLITAIKNDIAEADRQLALPEYEEFRDHTFFVDSNNKYVAQNNASSKGGITNDITNGHHNGDTTNGIDENKTT
ncbi:unnamed protein product, partial [Meganyctiphanes norvegica]